MKTLPRHPSGYNLPVDLGDHPTDYSKREKLTIRPFRGSWDPKQWGDLDGHPEFKPVSLTVAEREVRSFLKRFTSTPTEGEFNTLIESQLGEHHCRQVGYEFMTLLIVLFGYGDIDWKDVVSAHFEFESPILDRLATVRRLWVDHPTLECDVNHIRNGGWGHLSHAWSGGAYVGGDPGTRPSSKGYVASQMSAEAWERYLARRNR